MYNSNGFEKRVFYSLELKHEACKDHIANGLSLKDCVEKYNLSSHSLVHNWLRSLGYIDVVNQRTNYAYIGIENLQPVSNKSQKKDRPLTPDQEQITLLKKQLEDAKLLAEGYRRMIEIAESELKITIRKKPGTR